MRRTHGRVREVRPVGGRVRRTHGRVREVRPVGARVRRTEHGPVTRAGPRGAQPRAAHPTGPRGAVVLHRSTCRCYPSLDQPIARRSSRSGGRCPLCGSSAPVARDVLDPTDRLLRPGHPVRHPRSAAVVAPVARCASDDRWVLHPGRPGRRPQPDDHHCSEPAPASSAPVGPRSPVSRPRCPVGVRCPVRAPLCTPRFARSSHIFPVPRVVHGERSPSPGLLPPSTARPQLRPQVGEHVRPDVDVRRSSRHTGPVISTSAPTGQVAIIAIP